MAGTGPPPSSLLNPGPHNSVFEATLAQHSLHGGAAPLLGGRLAGSDPVGAPAAQPAPVWLQPAPHPLQHVPAGGAQQPHPSWAADPAAALDDPQAVAAKAAAAREKNRLAQQRFRERHRAMQKEAGAQCEVLAAEIEELEHGNGRLQRFNRMYERVLAVRDAMLQTFGSLQPGTTQHAQAAEAAQALLERQASAAVPGAAAAVPGAAAAAAARGFERALCELPTEAEMDEAAPSEDTEAASVAEPAATAAQQAVSSAASADQPAPAPPPTGGGGGRDSAADGGDGLAAGELRLGGVPPRNLLGEAYRTGIADVLDGSALRQLDLVPPPSNQLTREKILAMQAPDDLVAYVINWQAELRAAWLAGEAAGFDQEAVAEVEEVIEKMTQMWFHVAQMRPAYLSYLTCKMYPEYSAQLPLWREIASEVMPYIDERGRTLVRRSWHTYCKRLAKTAVGMSRWVQRLREYTVQSQVDSMATNAASALELAEIVSHIKEAVQEEYIASVELVAAQFPVSATLTKAYVNYRSLPYLPDLVAIVHQMLCLDNEERCHGCLPPITSGHAHPNLQLAPPPQRAAAGERDAGGDAAQA